MEEFEIFRKSIITSLTKGREALVTSYKDKKSQGYYGGIALLRNLNEIRVNKPNSLRVEATYISEIGNTRENPGFKPRVDNGWISWEPHHIGNHVVFKINDSRFVSELERVIEDYTQQDILSQVHFFPYYLPLFIKPISRALSSDRIELIFPKDEIKKKKAVKHLG